MGLPHYVTFGGMIVGSFPCSDLLFICTDIFPLPDPVIGEDSHYKEFTAVFGKTGDSFANSCNDMAPLHQPRKQKKSLGFNVTQQHVKNVGTVVQCDDCGMWRLLFSKVKLSPQSRLDLEKLLEEVSYTFGATLDDLDLPDSLKTVCVKYHSCHDPMEKLYYSASGFEPICFYCSKQAVCDTVTEASEYFPLWPNCVERPLVKRPKRKATKR